MIPEKQTIFNIVKTASPANPLAYVRDIVRPLSMQKLKECIINCKDCPICKNKVLPYGNPNASVLIIKDPKEDVSNIAYQEACPDDDMLKKTFEYYNFDLNQLLYMQSIQCTPQEVLQNKTVFRTPNKQEIDACRLYISFAIQSFAPVFIFLLGATPIKLFWNTTLESIRGKILHINSIPAIATYSTTYLRRIQATMPDSYEIQKDIFLQDIQKARDFIKTKYPVLIKGGKK